MAIIQIGKQHLMFQESMNDTLRRARELLSSNVTNCLLPVCNQIDEQLGKT